MPTPRRRRPHAASSAASARRRRLAMLKLLDHLEEMADRHPDGRGDAADLRRGACTATPPACRFPCCRTALHQASTCRWAQELCIYMFVWMAKFGAAYGVRTGIHVGVDVLVNQLPPDMRARCRAVRPARAARCSPASSARWARTSSGTSAHTDQVVARPRSCRCWIVYLCDPARLVPDVLPLPAGGLGVLAHRRAAAP